MIDPLLVLGSAGRQCSRLANGFRSVGAEMMISV